MRSSLPKSHLFFSQEPTLQSFTILSLFVTFLSCDMSRPNMDKSGILTPKIYLLLQKGLNKYLKTTSLFE